VTLGRVFKPGNRNVPPIRRPVDAFRPQREHRAISNAQRATRFARHATRQVSVAFRQLTLQPSDIDEDA
jgi:hypothetical protein